MELVLEYLPMCYDEIVQPMSQVFRKIMSFFHLSVEGELYSSDLKFRLSYIRGKDQNLQYTGDSGMKQENTISNLNTLKRFHTSRFQEILKLILTKYLPTDPHAKLNLAVAIYLATYFHPSNHSCISLLGQYNEVSGLKKFVEMWQEKEGMWDGTDRSQVEHLDEFKLKLKSDFQFYQVICSEAEEGNPKKMMKLLTAKKIFSVPWLLCGEQLFLNYPDQFDTQAFKDSLRSLSLNPFKPSHASESTNRASSSQIA
jgi:hypothetical protein